MKRGVAPASGEVVLPHSQSNQVSEDSPET